MGPFIHDIDPVFAEVGGLYLWWYGASYSFGFAAAFLWLGASRERLGFGTDEVYRLTLYIAVGVLLGGRAVEVIFYEWAYYGEHPWHIPAVWLGGMSTHGILLGASLSVLLFCHRNRFSFLQVGDVLVFAAAFIMGFGRLGNFVDGQIVGSLTEMPWGVKFPDLDGFRHPVVLYDGLKNLLLIPLLLLVRSRLPPRGVLVAHFLLWYGLLRIFVDFFREYRSSLYGLPPGQEFNLLMTFIGIGMLIWLYRRRRSVGGDVRATARVEATTAELCSRLWRMRLALVLILIFPMVIPSDWTQDVPARYGERHPGMTHSKIYPPVTRSQ